MGVKERIKQFCKLEGSTVAAFEESIGASNGYVNSISKSIGLERLNVIIEKYPNINLEWLLTGRGDMLKTKGASQNGSRSVIAMASRKDTDNQQTNQIEYTKGSQTRPRIPFEAAAGSLSIAVDSIKEGQCERFPVITSLPEYDFTIIARGESMAPVIESGDELACRFTTESSFIQWGRTYVLDTTEGVIVKRIFDNGECILCKSNNPNYPAYPVNKKEIYRMALVVGLLRQF